MSSTPYAGDRVTFEYGDERGIISQRDGEFMRFITDAQFSNASPNNRSRSSKTYALIIDEETKQLIKFPIDGSLRLWFS